MKKEVVYSEKAPKPIGPYSQAIKAGNFVFISGQIPLDPKTGEIIKDDFRKAVKTVLENIKNIVEASGGSLENIVKVTVYMKDLGKFTEFNTIYGEYFKEKPPARVVIEASHLPKNVDLEVEAIAYLE